MKDINGKTAYVSGAGSGIGFGITTALAVTLDSEKLPKCSMPLCRSVGCSASTLCAKGTTVKTCADICHGG